MPAIAGVNIAGSSDAGQVQRSAEQIFMNKGGGGEVLIKRKVGLTSGSCNLPQTLVFAIWSRSRFCGPLHAKQAVPLFDQRVFPTDVVPGVLYQPPISRFGGRVDNLDTADEVRRGVQALADTKSGANPLLQPTGALFDATVNLMENPIATAKGRQLMVDNLVSEIGAAPVVSTDPRGREAMLIEVPDTSRFGVLLFPVGDQVKSYDLTESKTILQLFYDPQTFDILARRVLLASTPVAELQEFLASGPAPIFTETLNPTKIRRRPDLVAYRIPCSKVEDAGPNDNFCVELGAPGGQSISIKKP
jgi:hypothetical protein